jgi:hypothetical protein
LDSEIMEGCIVRRAWVSLIGGCFFALVLLCGGSSGGAEPKVLRVCADPDNLPFSNDKLEGFENKIAELVTQDLGAQLNYTWWPHQRGLVRRTLNQDLCDVPIGIPKGYDLVLWTTPYYRTAYVIASVKERGLQITGARSTFRLAALPATVPVAAVAWAQPSSTTNGNLAVMIAPCSS